MIQEDYVSFEIAKLLKEKGFPIEEFHKGIIGTFKGIAVSKITKEMIEKEILSCIPQSVVMKWLRKVHNIFVSIDYSHICEQFRYTICLKDSSLRNYDAHTDYIFNSYENACEAAIKYCLTNLI